VRVEVSTDDGPRELEVLHDWDRLGRRLLEDLREQGDRGQVEVLASELAPRSVVGDEVAREEQGVRGNEKQKDLRRTDELVREAVQGRVDDRSVLEPEFDTVRLHGHLT
jgi:hypothetical protein